MGVDEFLNDLEGEFDAARRRMLRDESEESAQSQAIEVSLAGRLLASVGQEITLFLADGTQISGRLEVAYEKWVALRGAGAEHYVPFTAIAGGKGLSLAPRWPNTIEQRGAITIPLRRLMMGRREVLINCTGGSWRGKITRVGADFIDLLEAGQSSIAVAIATIIQIRTWK